jgi:hypothetical protein
MEKKFPILLSVKKIWSKAKHNALTDLIRYKNRWFCIFRESSKHVYGKNGTIRLIVSEDGETWKSLAHLKEAYVDLRDPKLSITPDGRLMMLVGGTVYRGKKYISRQSRVAFSEDGKKWTPFQLVVEPHEWLWRVTWHQGKAYGVSYSYSDIKNKKDEWNIKLFESDNGLDYRLITQWPIIEHPNETTLRFLEGDRMLALVRRDGPEDRKAWMGISDPPYVDWTWNPMHGYLGGPNFLILPDQRMFAAGRVLMFSPYGFFAKTILAKLELCDFEPLIALPSFGDSSYPGLVYHEDELWMSYYSTHEDDTTSIYLAKFKI